jgi:hypothetical protein
MTLSGGSKCVRLTGRLKLRTFSLFDIGLLDSLLLSISVPWDRLLAEIRANQGLPAALIREGQAEVVLANGLRPSLCIE